MSEPEKKPRRRVKKVKGHGGHHGGAWKVAYADFVTAMMALFLVLWLVSQADTKLKQAIANYFRTPGVFDTVKGGIMPGQTKTTKEPEDLTFKDDEDALFSIARALRKEMESRNELNEVKDRVKIEMTEEGLRIQILDKANEVSFPSGSPQLAEDARLILREIAEAICELPNPILIGGHTDSHVFSADNSYTNWELSADRANAARRELQTGCVKPEQIRKIVGYADTVPLVPGDPYAPANRRISITVLRLNRENADEETTKKSGKKFGKESDETEDSAETEEAESETRTVSIPAQKQAAKTAASPQAKNDSDEKRAAKAKLASEGAVTVGESDAVPAGVKKSAEPKTKDEGGRMKDEKD